MRPSALPRGLAALLLCAAAACAHAAKPTVGAAPPDYLGRNLERDVIRTDKYAGKALVVTFWATWCPYCLKELPILSGIRQASKGAVQVVAINTESRDVFRKVTNTLKDVDVDLLYDPDHKAQDEFGASSLPHMLIIGRDGKIVHIFHGYDESSLPAIADALNRATGSTE